MAKPNITTRATKGSALTWSEGDANLENLRDATISIKADTAGTSVVSDLNGEITLVAGTNVTLTGDNTAKTITIDAAGGSGIALTDLSGSRGIDYNNTTGEIKLTSSGLPTQYTGNVTSIDGDTGDWIYVPSVSAGFMMSYQIQFQGAGLMGTNIMMGMNYWIKDVDYANNRFTISDTMGGSVKDLNSATGLTDVTYQISMGGSSTYKLQYNSSMGTVSWTTDSTTPTTQSLSGLSDVSVFPPITDGYVLTYDSSLGKWQAEAPAGGGISNIVEDTTPQLGGTLDANGNEIDMGTNNITDTKVGNWDTAYSWGNHASAGYQSALGFTPENSSNKGTANGYASLDANGLVPSTQLPSYVDDVLEYASLATFPATGETGKIYVAADTSRSYRWTGSVYSEIIASPGTTDNVTEGSTNLYFTTARARSSVSAGTGISYDSATGVITSTVTSGIASVNADTAPMLGGNLDVNGKSIVSVSNGNIILSPNGTGIIRADKSLQVQAQGELRLADSDSSNYVGFKSPATVSTNKIWTLPAADGTNGQVLSTNGSGTLSWATAGGGGASFALATAQSGLYTSGTNKNIMWTENYDSASCLSVNATTGEFTLTAGSYILSLQGMGRIGSQGNGLQFYNVTGAAIVQDMGYNFPWDGGTTYMIPVGSFYLTPASSTTYVFRFTGNPSSTSITSTVLNLVIRKVA